MTCNECIHFNVCYRQIEVNLNYAKKCGDYLPQKYGKWISDLKSYGDGNDDYHCSICGRSIHLCRPLEQLTDYPYCHCGAKMESEEEK